MLHESAIIIIITGNSATQWKGDIISLKQMSDRVGETQRNKPSRASLEWPALFRAANRVDNGEDGEEELRMCVGGSPVFFWILQLLVLSTREFGISKSGFMLVSGAEYQSNECRNGLEASMLALVFKNVWYVSLDTRLCLSGLLSLPWETFLFHLHFTRDKAREILLFLLYSNFSLENILW